MINTTYDSQITTAPPPLAALPPTAAPSTDTTNARLFDLVTLATSGMPVAELMRRMAESLASMINCGFCGLAVRVKRDDTVSLRISRRDKAGTWGAWKTVSPAGSNGGNLTEQVQSQATGIVVNDWESAAFQDPCLEQQGIASGIVFPMIRGNTNFGTLGTYDHAARCFGSEDVNVVEAAANLLAGVLEHHCLEQQFLSTSAVQIAMWQSGSTALAVSDPSFHIVQINQAMEDLSKFKFEDLRGRAMISVFVNPKDASVMGSLLSKVRPGDPPSSFTSDFLTKDGVTRRVSWSFTAISLPDNQVQILASGQDVTEGAAATERAERAEALNKVYLENLYALKTAVDSGDLVQVRRVIYDVAQRNCPDNDAANTVAENLMKAANKRAHARVSLRSLQHLAPYVPGKVPETSDFLRVLCNDLSAGGVSFFIPERPKHKEFVVVLGVPGNAILMRATVTNCRLVEEEGIPQYLVGCKFNGRLSAPSP